MATATAIGLQVSRRINDASQVALSAAAILDYINMALADLSAAGWLQPQNEDTSLTLATDTYSYSVPSGFAYIRRVQVADADGTYPSDLVIPQNHWELSIVSGTAKIVFWPDVSDRLIAGRALKVIGQKRPTVGVSGSDTIVSGMEAFVRERAAAYAAEQLGMGTSELDQYRGKMAQSLWAKSQQMLGYHPQEFRVKPNSRLVPAA